MGNRPEFIWTHLGVVFTGTRKATVNIPNGQHLSTTTKGRTRWISA